MEDLGTFLKYLDEGRGSEDPDVLAFINSERGKSLSGSIEKLKGFLSRVKTGSGACNHDIENICAYYEDQLAGKEKEQVESVIYSCDNCFQLYTFLLDTAGLAQLQPVPSWLKDKVIPEEKNKAVFGKILAGFREKFGPRAYGGLAVASLLVVILVALPINKEYYQEEASVTAKYENTEKQVVEPEGDSGVNLKDEVSSEIGKALKSQVAVPQERITDSANKAQETVVHIEKPKAQNQVASSPERAVEKVPPMPARTPVATGLENTGGASEPLSRKELPPESKPGVGISEPEKKEITEENQAFIVQNPAAVQQKPFEDPAPAPASDTLRKAAEARVRNDSFSTGINEVELRVNNIIMKQPGFIYIYLIQDNKPVEVLVQSELLPQGTFEYIKMKAEKNKVSGKAAAFIFYDTNDNGLLEDNEKVIPAQGSENYKEIVITTD